MADTSAVERPERARATAGPRRPGVAAARPRAAARPAGAAQPDVERGAARSAAGPQSRLGGGGGGLAFGGAGQPGAGRLDPFASRLQTTGPLSSLGRGPVVFLGLVRAARRSSRTDRATARPRACANAAAWGERLSGRADTPRLLVRELAPRAVERAGVESPPTRSRLQERNAVEGRDPENGPSADVVAPFELAPGHPLRRAGC